MYKGKSLRRADKHLNTRNTCHVHRDLNSVQGFADICLYTGTCFSKLPLHILSLQTALFKEWNLYNTDFLPFCRQPEVKGDVGYHNCSFMEEGKVIYPINVNSDLFISIYQHANIKTEIATKIEQYRKTVSKIESLQWLLDDGILTPMEWQDTFFRIYVG